MRNRFGFCNGVDPWSAGQCQCVLGEADADGTHTHDCDVVGEELERNDSEDWR